MEFNEEGYDRLPSFAQRRKRWSDGTSRQPEIEIVYQGDGELMIAVSDELPKKLSEICLPGTSSWVARLLASDIGIANRTRSASTNRTSSSACDVSCNHIAAMTPLSYQSVAESKNTNSGRGFPFEKLDGLSQVSDHG